MATLHEITSNFQKLDKFEGVGLRQWQKKIHFFWPLWRLYIF